jgi:Raf kinase inhibitor-like YbhB/YbcL family protein
MLENLPDAVGHALADQRAGLDQLVLHTIGLRGGLGAIEVRSLAFADHAPIPARYTADGEGVSPPLQWQGLPDSTGSVVLIVEDADSPTPRPLVHAIVVELKPDEAALAEGALPSADHDGLQIKTGKNSVLAARWLPPDPPPGHGVHRYAFQVFALGAIVSFSDAPGRDEVVEVLRASAIAGGMLIGTYERPDASIKDEATASAASLPGAALPLSAA